MAFSVSLGPNSWFRAWELKLTFVLWAAISFQVLGWFSGLERTLDNVDLIPGKEKFSLWSLLKGIVVIAGFLVVTSLIARTIERRVMKLEGLAISTRIGISKFSTFALIGIGALLGINASGVDLTVLGVIERRDRPRPGFRARGQIRQGRRATPRGRARGAHEHRRRVCVQGRCRDPALSRGHGAVGTPRRQSRVE